MQPRKFSRTGKAHHWSCGIQGHKVLRTSSLLALNMYFQILQLEWSIGFDQQTSGQNTCLLTSVLYVYFSVYLHLQSLPLSYWI